MNCTKCGSPVPENDNVRFCPECGSPLLPQIQIPQANAGTGAPQQARTARGYGAPARNAAPSQQSGAQSAPATYGGYTPQGAGYAPQNDAAMVGGSPSVGYTPGGPGYTPPGEGGPQAEEPKEGGSGGNKKFLAIVIPLIAVILASLVVIFIFVIYPELKDDTEETVTEPTTASQEAESDTQAPSTPAATESAVSEEPSETESVTAAAPVSASGYNTGHYVNSTESRVHIRNTTSKSGKHVDYVQPDEYIDVFEVLDLGASTDATVRWWGKVTKGGKTGWISLYYLTCVDLVGTPLDSAQIDQLWQTLQGYWNTLDKKRYSSFSTDNGSPYFVYSPWSGSAVISASVDAEGMGDLNGLIRLHLNEDAAGASGAVNAELYLDLSEMKNGRLAWSFGTGWEDGYFAGTDQSKAKPKS